MERDSKFVDFLDSPEGQKMFNRIAAQEKARKRRAKAAWQKWEKEFTKNIIKKGKFDDWMTKMVSDHSLSYRKRLMSRSIQPHPNRNLSRTFSFAEKHGNIIKSKKKLDKYTPNEFTSSLVEYEGYYFHIVHGQGVGFSVLKSVGDRKAERIITL